MGESGGEGGRHKMLYGAQKIQLSRTTGFESAP